VELSAPLFGDLSLSITDRAPSADTHDGRYPAARLQRGLLLVCPGRDLAEEGVGFGVPILKRGAQTVFPGAMELRQGGAPSGNGTPVSEEIPGAESAPGAEGAPGRNGADWQAIAVFEMNLVERLAPRGSAGLNSEAGPGGAPGGGPRSRSFYAVRDALAALHRRVPPLRGLLTATSNAVRRGFGLVTTFEETTTVATLGVTYEVRSDDGLVHVTVDLTGLPADNLSEVVVMNELGARCFDQYRDSDGTRLRGAGIGTWTRVTAEKASLLCGAAGVAISLGQEPGARLYRGWELVGSRLAWAGFGYTVQRGVESFGYDVSIESVERGARPHPLEHGASERNESIESAS
jgi:hypothetical protein